MCIDIFLKIEVCKGGVVLYAGSSFIRVNMVFYIILFNLMNRALCLMQSPADHALY
jgi:hypothetical protein